MNASTRDLTAAAAVIIQPCHSGKLTCFEIPVFRDAKSISWRNFARYIA